MATGAQLTTLAIAEQDWKELLEDLLPPQGRWSEDEYLVLTDHRNRLVEFTDGFLEALPMPTDKHQSVLGFLYVIHSCSSCNLWVARSVLPLMPAHSAGQVS